MYIYNNKYSNKKHNSTNIIEILHSNNILYFLYILFFLVGLITIFAINNLKVNCLINLTNDSKIIFTAF